jgi:hypothetical protein
VEREEWRREELGVEEWRREEWRREEWRREESGGLRFFSYPVLFSCPLSFIRAYSLSLSQN